MSDHGFGSFQVLAETIRTVRPAAICIVSVEFIVTGDYRVSEPPERRLNRRQ